MGEIELNRQLFESFIFLIYIKCGVLNSTKSADSLPFSCTSAQVVPVLFTEPFKWLIFSDYSFSVCLSLDSQSLSSILLFYHPKVIDESTLIVSSSVLEFSFQSVSDNATFLLKMTHTEPQKNPNFLVKQTYFLFHLLPLFLLKLTFQWYHGIRSLKTSFTSSPGVMYVSWYSARMSFTLGGLLRYFVYPFASIAH